MKSNMNALVKQLKEEDCDFEYYPTTVEMVQAIAKNMFYDDRRILDIGCGQGDFIKKLDAIQSGSNFWQRKFFGIEKSPVLFDRLPDNVTLLGTDFNEQTLLDKDMDVIFCNPPYSQYERWADKIIREGNFRKKMFLVLPQRWKENKLILEAIAKRNVYAKVILTSDFYEAERKARAKVDVILIEKNDAPGNKTKEAFDLWFEDTFKIQAERDSKDFSYEIKEKLENNLVQTDNIAQQLLDFYQADMERLFGNYKSLETMDAGLLKELNVDLVNLKTGLQEKIKGLKHVYWDKLFRSYDKITKRLTSFSRDYILSGMRENADIDFTLNNIYAVTMWVIKNSNTMYDKQLVHYYTMLASEESIKTYKSNRHYNAGDWRGYRFHEGIKEGKISHFMYDYRIVYQKIGHNFETGWYGRYNDLTTTSANFILDTITIAENLGCQITNPLEISTNNTCYYSGNGWGNKDILYTNGKPFCNVKMYKNGNIHLKFDTAFMQKLNVEASRLLGWVTSKEECAEELEMNPATVEKLWNCNKKIELTDGLQVLRITEK